MGIKRAVVRGGIKNSDVDFVLGIDLATGESVETFSQIPIEEEMNKLSVIIPAYNAVGTVERTVQSVLASTLPVDLWVVDDGSTDGTGLSLDELAATAHSANGSVLRVIHQQNSGCYQARLTALKQIATPYFGFADADDTVDADMFEKMLALAEAKCLDVVQTGYDIGGRVVLPTGGAGGILDNDSELYSQFVHPRLIDVRESCFVWNKIYRNQYDFSVFDETDHVTNFEDLIFNLQFFVPVKRMGFIYEPLYHYAETAGSAVHSFSQKKVKDFREAWRVRKAMLPKYGLTADCAENQRWFRRNRLNCIKAAVKAGNLGVFEKLKLIYELMRVR